MFAHIRNMRNLALLLCPLLFACLLQPSCGQTWDDAEELMTDKLKSYNKNHRPIIDQSKAMQVNVSFEMVFIQSLDEVTGKFTAFGIFVLSWIDEKIVWDPADYGGVWSQLYNVKDVWYPLLVATSSSDKVDDIADDWMTVRIMFYGGAFFTPGVVLKSICGIDVTYYPFDTQECTMSFAPWGLWPNEIKMVSISPYALGTYYTEGGEWEIVANFTYVDDYNNLYISFTLKRKPLFAVINIVMPIVLMSALNVLVFILPPEAGERISFAITVLLSTAVFMTLVADNLPKTSQPMSILAYFLLVNLTISALMCVATIINLRVYFKKETHPVPSWAKRLVRVVYCKSCCANAKKFNIKNEVVPYELSAIPKKDKQDAGKENMRPKDDTSREDVITWQDVAAALDRVYLVSFVVTFVTSTIVFVVILAINKGAIETTDD